MRVSRIRKARKRRGAEVVEAALVLSLVVPTLLGVVEYGRLVMIRQLMRNAARECARMAVVGTASNPPTTTTQIQAAAKSYMVGQSLDGFAVSVYQADPLTGNSIGAWDQTPYGGAVAVKITGNYTPIVTSLFQPKTKTIPFQAVAMMLSEAN